MHSGHGERRRVPPPRCYQPGLEWIYHIGWFVRAAAVFAYIASPAVTPMPTVKSKMCDNFCCKVCLSLMKTSAHRLLCEEMWVTYIRIHIMWNPYISYDWHTSHTEPVISYMSTVILNSCRDILELQFPGKATLQVFSCSHPHVAQVESFRHLPPCPPPCLSEVHDNRNGIRQQEVCQCTIYRKIKSCSLCMENKI